MTRKTNPAVHRLNFRSLSQSEGEQTKNFLVRLKASAKDCMFECPACKHDLSEMNIKDQLIRGLSNHSLQTDILAKADQLQELESIIKHAEAFETALHDQAELTKPAEERRLSNYKKTTRHRTNQPPREDFDRNNSIPPRTDFTKRNYNQPRENFYTQNTRRDNHTKRRCIGCGSLDHSSDNYDERRSKCPAWGQRCSTCKGLNHFSSSCFSKRAPQRARVNEIQTENDDDYEDDDENIIAHVHLVENFYTTVAAVTVQQIPAILTPIHPNGKPTESLIFPDSGASICLASPEHLKNLGINEKDLTPTNKKVMAVGGAILSCLGSILTKFKIHNRTTTQRLYICNNIDRIYFSKDGCLETNILPQSFPHPMPQPKNTTKINSVEQETNPLHSPESTINQTRTTKNSTNKRPKILPFRPTKENIPKLKDFLIKSFPKVFNKSTPFREMKCKPAKIHLKEGAKPTAVHTPIPVPIHWRDEIKQSLDEDVRNGIIEPVPVGETEW